MIFLLEKLYQQGKMDAAQQIQPSGQAPENRLVRHMNLNLGQHPEQPGQQPTDFYQQIVGLTLAARQRYNSVRRQQEEDAEKYRQAIGELAAAILTSSAVNIKTAAGHGHTTAFLCVFHQDALYRDRIAVMPYLQMPAALQELLARHNIESLTEKIGRILTPFILTIEPIFINGAASGYHALTVAWEVDGQLGEGRIDSPVVGSDQQPPVEWHPV